ncbi:dolichyl-P-Man:Man(5)GlcNAc(2)-PP-dolichol alpha-1,3-mannosyltransferase [Serendipita sp. 400]|nr:dolichyl-P-Man:Man(5)GlcNAc(2)-PP-dolichol alpha-1,3-mannosyltransferase [Serendipita sp. 400]
MIHLVKALLFNRHHFWKLMTLVIIGDALLTLLIIHFVPYTEIDFETYIIQAKKVQDGQRDYSLIYGPSGPLVYPAGHVAIHRILAFILNATSFRTIQYIYGTLYIASLTISCMLYHRAKSIPNWVILLLPLSKRLHSIYVLRLFNDCWSTTLALGAVYLFSFVGNELLACFLFSFALSVKMNIFLYMPGLLVVFLKSLGVIESLVHVVIILLLQVWLGMPFIMAHPKSYFTNAFDLSRQFLYKWTVNWRFIPEDVFLSRRFALTLLMGHLSVLVLFAFRKWFQNDGGLLATVRRGFIKPFQRASWDLPTGDEIITILFTSNLIGVTFARSLHYQFYSWYAQQLPLLLWRTKYPLPIKLALLLGVEYSWNVFPSTNTSSYILNASHILIIGGLWFGYPTGTRRKKVSFKDNIHEVEDNTDVPFSELD